MTLQANTTQLDSQSTSKHGEPAKFLITLADVGSGPGPHAHAAQTRALRVRLNSVPGTRRW